MLPICYSDVTLLKKIIAESAIIGKGRREIGGNTELKYGIDTIHYMKMQYYACFHA